MQRREFLGASVLALANSTWLNSCLAGAGENGRPLYLSAAAEPDGSYWLQAFSVQLGALQPHYRIALPERGHHVAVDPARRLFVVIARRPDTWLVLGDLDSGELLQELRVPTQRHLYGHGIFSADGEFFYTTESDLRDPQGDNGLVVEWRVERQGAKPVLQREREFSSGGVGPHELLLHPDGETLVIANGGLRTHPDTGREVLNVDSMQSSLVYLDRHNGQLLERQVMPPELRLASIRHLAVNSSAQVVLGMQYQGEAFEQVPLVATHSRGAALRLLDTPAELLGRMKQYVGSVCYSADGAWLAATCPRGNLLAFWSAEDGRFVGSIPARDGCGICASEDGFLFSSGVGRIARYDPRADAVAEFNPPHDWQLFWDNHMTAVAPGWTA
ncbi:MAG TPA: DUF1513 domain-containing protein [Pseudomonadaceae bacterium]|nr:DUF1513 domain-containing protein [Pseudomonadaceae bacterium]